jgi:prevent-host-death family protein
MERVGIYQAKARLSELIERVERGEEVTITKNKKPVARIVPARAGKGKAAPEVDHRAAVEELRQFAKTVRLPRRLSVRELKRLAAEGRD